MRTRGVGYVCVTAVFTASVGAQTVELPGGDMRTQTVTGWSGGLPQQAKQVGDRLFYKSSDALHGLQWWVTDGTPAGTMMVGDESIAWSFAGSMNGDALFWKSDGSVVVPAGTREAGGYRAEGPRTWPRVIQAGGDAAGSMLADEEDSTSCRLWWSNSGTMNAAPIEGLGTFQSVSPIVNHQGRAYLTLTANGTPRLYVSDGTMAGTLPLPVAQTGRFGLSAWLGVGDRFFFQQPTGNLYVTEGSPGTTRQVDIASNGFLWFAGELHGEAVYVNGAILRMTQSGGSPITLTQGMNSTRATATVWNGDAYCFKNNALHLVSEEAWSLRLSPTSVVATGFVTTVPNDGGRVIAGMVGVNNRNPELWTTDGTPGGTRRFAELGPGQTLSSMEHLGFARGADGRSRVLFSIQTFGPAGSANVLMASDGTAAGTLVLSRPEAFTGNASPRDAFLNNGAMYVEIDATTTGRERYRLDPETADLTLCEELVAGAAGVARTETLSGPTGTYSIANADGPSTVIRGASTPSAAGAVVASWPGVNVLAGQVGMGMIFGDRLIFRGLSPNGQGGYYNGISTLWETDIAGRARPLADHTWLAEPRVFFAAESAAWCFARQSQNGATGLFRYDGEHAELFLPMAAGEELSAVTAVIGSRVVFRLTAWPYGMFSIDLVTGDRRTISSTTARDLMVYRGLAYFPEGTTAGWRIRKTDGTAEGTSTIFERTESNTFGNPTLLAVGPGPDGRDRLYFSAAEDGQGNELWMTDGTTAGTVRVTDIGADILDANPTNAVVVGNRVCFLANDHEHGREWWATNGEVTTRLTDLEPGAGSIRMTWAKSVGSRVLFDAMSSLYGRELWMLTVECPADFNGDGFVDFFDYADFVACYEGGECPGERSPDFNRDDFVDFFDYIGYVEAFELGC